MEKPKRIIKPRCSHSNLNTNSKAKNSFLCALITDQEREKIHSYFWTLESWAEKKAFVRAAAVRRKIRRRRKGSKSTKKGSGHDIFLSKDDKNYTKVKVCRLFFLHTLCIGEDSFRRWTKEFTLQNDVNKDSENDNNLGNESGSISKYKRQQEEVKTWLGLLPKVPSHYCRASTNKLYVESTFRLEKHMHEVYVEWCNDNNYQAVSRTTFVKALKQENIAIHHPRKDQCDTCCSFKSGNISQTEYDDHILKKNEARQAKEDAIGLANNKTAVITVDVQSVLLAPKLLASAAYYKLKLQCHNFSL